MMVILMSRSGTYSVQKLVSTPGRGERWSAVGLGTTALHWDSCAAATKSIRSLQPLAHRDPAWAGVYRVRCGGSTLATVVLLSRKKRPAGKRYGDARFPAETAARITALEDERDEIQQMIAQLEDFVFMEETAMKVSADIQRLAHKYPASRNLAAAASVAARGFERFHHGVLDKLSRALDELDDAADVRASELYDLEQ